MPTTPTLRRNALLAQSVEHLHGKEGVDGSSPSEGSSGSRVVPGVAGSVIAWRSVEAPVHGNDSETEIPRRSTCLRRLVTAGHPVVVGGSQGGISHFGSRYWEKSLTL